jgi:hypothetical protein
VDKRREGYMKITSSRQGNALMDLIMTMISVYDRGIYTKIIKLNIDGNFVYIDTGTKNVAPYKIDLDKDVIEEIKTKILKGEKQGEVTVKDIDPFIQSVIKNALSYYLVERPLKMIPKECKVIYVKILKGLIKGIQKGTDDLADMIEWIQKYYKEIEEDNEIPQDVKGWITDASNNINAIKPYHSFNIHVDKKALVKVLERVKIK